MWAWIYSILIDVETGRECPRIIFHSWVRQIDCHPWYNYIQLLYTSLVEIKKHNFVVQNRALWAIIAFKPGRIWGFTPPCGAPWYAGEILISHTRGQTALIGVKYTRVERLASAVWAPERKFASRQLYPFRGTTPRPILMNFGTLGGPENAITWANFGFMTGSGVLFCECPKMEFSSTAAIAHKNATLPCTQVIIIIAAWLPWSEVQWIDAVSGTTQRAKGVHGRKQTNGNVPPVVVHKSNSEKQNWADTIVCKQWVIKQIWGMLQLRKV
jgi:hypothetical protein